jgi:hypothetical protein
MSWQSADRGHVDRLSAAGLAGLAGKYGADLPRARHNVPRPHKKLPKQGQR